MVSNLEPFPDPGPLDTLNEVELWAQSAADWVRTTLIQSWNDRLVADLETKAESSHTHVEADITDLDHSTDITGQTALTEVPALDDEFILYDSSATANRKVDFQYLKGDLAQEAAAAGSTQGTATAITGHFVEFNTVVASSAEGGVLPGWGKGARVLVENSDAADTLKLYPPSGGEINSLGSNNAIDVPASGWAICRNVDGTIWRVKVI